MHLSKSGNPSIKDARLDPNFVPRTAITRWRIPACPKVEAYLKHEDEVRHAVTAGKLRKMASILPALRNRGIQQAVVIGGANSNHLVSACQILIQAGIRPIPFVKTTHSEGTNQFLLKLLTNSSEWNTFNNHTWATVAKAARAFADAQEVPTAVVHEGCFQREALRGAMTLADDILRHEQELKCSFSDIFVDAGTGLSAMALALGLTRMHMKARLHVTLMADHEAAFWAKSDEMEQWYQTEFEEDPPNWRDRVLLHLPAFAASFGSVNAQLIEAIQDFGRRGLLVDPIYSAKHLYTAEALIAASEDGMTRPLLIHSGGAQALPGFAARFFPK